MNESNAKKALYNYQRFQYLAEFDEWLDRKPSRWRIFAWRRWLKQKPVWRVFDE